MIADATAGIRPLLTYSALYVRQQIEVFIIFVPATLTQADVLLRLDEFGSLDPFDHLVAKLIFRFASPVEPRIPRY
ncbi:MAG: hypothetical protein JWN34_5466 [Bryobacterales bacterium]|nr:hypothetical protein [Bryobacterales bacterium]